MHDKIAIETDLFEHRNVKPHFINPCCFGEDFALWLKRELAPLTKDGFSFSEPIQEDYGWGFWAREGESSFWIAVSCIGTGPQDYDGEWGISISYDPGLNVLRRLFHEPDLQSFDRLRTQVSQALEAEQAESNMAIHIQGWTVSDLQP